MGKKIICYLLIGMIVIASASTTMASSIPYESYNYDNWKNVLPSPAAYAPVESISGDMLGIENFTSPGDMFVKDDYIYLSDSGKNRIVIFDMNKNLVRVIDSFLNNGKQDHFNSPQGIFVTKNNELYIADSENRRVVVLDEKDNLIKEIKDPKAESISEQFIFNPMKIAVDDADRVYVIAKNVFEGIMCFDVTGDFFGYFGTIKVTVDPLDYFWRILSTKEQRAKMDLFIPTEFSSLDIDSEGFIYGTNIDMGSNQMIKRLNPSGNDVLVNYNKKKNIIGDLEFRAVGALSGPSVFVDIKTREGGIYSSLDTTRGRVFTYDSEGNLLYIFGGVGNMLGLFKKPQAIESYGDDILVLDQARGEVVRFTTTEYGRLINKATRLRYDGEEAEAVAYWEEVLKLDANYELAYDGIGKSLLAANRNKEALAYLKKSLNVDYYSVAFKRYRTEVLSANLSIILNIGLVIGVSIGGYKLYRKIQKKRSEEA